MPLRIHGHPLSMYYWKAAIALEEAGLPYELAMVDLGDPDSAARLRKLSPFGMMPALEDEGRGRTVFESSIVIEYLARAYPQAAALVPADPDAALEVRLWDRVFDLHVSNHLQAIVFNRIRPAGARDRLGVEQAHEKLRASYDVLEDHLAGRAWAAGDFSMADCAAAPALHYARKVEPFGARPALGAYLERLEARPCFARVLKAAEPYAHMFPAEPEPA